MREAFFVPLPVVQVVTEERDIMRTHNLTIIASGLNPLAAGFANCLFEAGCDDATIAVQKGLIVLEFDREATTFTHALMTALGDVTRAGAIIERVEPDYLVSAADIAKRCGQGRAAISLYVNGERGSEFPHPIARVTSDSPLYDWAEVASWLHKRGKVSLMDVIQARTVREVNRYVTKQHLDGSFLGRRLSAQRTPPWKVYAAA